MEVRIGGKLVGEKAGPRVPGQDWPWWRDIKEGQKREVGDP